MPHSITTKNKEMKRIKVLFVFALLNLTMLLHAQKPIVMQQADRIATKMKDTLGLTIPQKNQVYAVNISLYNQKMVVRKQYTNMDSITVQIQRIENKRDSLYHIILPEPKYILYRQKKRNLVSVN
jgi:hypothetical protein